MNTQQFFNGKKLQNDNVYPIVERKEMSKLTRYAPTKPNQFAIISNDKLVNVVSAQYGLLPNQRFYLSVEQALRDADINYVRRSVNRGDCSFSVDYILNDDRYYISVKSGKDILSPMMRFTNSYDGSCKTAGFFGFHRLVCSNGLTVSHTNVGFSLKHRGNVCELILPRIDETIKMFMENEFYTLKRKFEVLAERPIGNLEDFVKYVCGETKLFKYESSEKNPEPGKLARDVMSIVQTESSSLGQRPSLWLGYNAFNEVLHGTMKKTFTQQRQLDGVLLETIANIN